jgi:hypothetical protein
VKKLSDYIDSYGMIVTTDTYDGGDSCAHGCAILYAAAVTGTPSLNPWQYVSNLEKSPGLYVRHPDPAKWYSRTNTFSRDQMTPLLALLGLLKDKKRLWQIFVRHLYHVLLFSWNTRRNDSYPDEHTGVSYAWKIPDLTIMDTWGVYIRGFRLWPLYPLLLICDLPTLVGSLIYRMKWSDSTIQMNHIVMVDFANRIMATPVSWIAKKIYGKEIPKAALIASWGVWWQPPVDEYLTRLIEETW